MRRLGTGVMVARAVVDPTHDDGEAVVLSGAPGVLVVRKFLLVGHPPQGFMVPRAIVESHP